MKNEIPSGIQTNSTDIKPGAISRSRSSGPATARRMLVAAWLAFIPALAWGQPITNHTFENGQTHGWGPRGPVTVVSSTDVARTGAASLKTTGRTASWNGPAIDLRSMLQANTTYQISGWVRLVAGQPQSSLKFTAERTPAGGAVTFTQVTAPQATTDAAWVQLQGIFSFPDASNDVLTLYLESDDPTSAYYLDDFTITVLSAPGCPEPHDQSGLFTDFESGGAEGWNPRGPAALTNTADAAHEGLRSLAVTNRAASWQGPTINVLCKMHKGSKYLISVWVRLLPGQPATDMRVSLQAGLNGAVSFLTVIGNQSVTDAAWVNFSTEYTFALDVDQLELYVESAAGTSSFYIDDFLLAFVPVPPIQTDLPSLRDVITEFPIGAAIEPPETVGRHGELLVKHFDTFTAGNSMKWDALWPTEAAFNFTRADTLANFARAHGQLMRGHTLLWHAQTAPWVFQDASGNPLQPGNAAHRQLLIDRLQTFISTVVPRYDDVVFAWDVVNEVIDPGQPDGLRRSPWYNIIGPEYIDFAFQFAAEAGANGLYINDFNTHEPAKLAALRAIVQGMLARGIPIDGVGHQMHINVRQPSLEQIRTSIQTFGDLGLDNQITEMDVSVYTNGTDTSPPTEQVLIEQGYRYRDVFNVFRDLQDMISSVTLWGLGDDTSWLKNFPITRDDKPLLFDEDLQAKHAYWGVVDPRRLPIIPKELEVSRGTVQVEGLPDIRWNALAPQALESRDSEETWATFKALWNGSTLYLLVEADDRLRAGDGVNVFVGETNFRFENFGRRNVNGAPGVILPTLAGYRLEAAIPVGLELAVGDEIRFDVRVTDTAGAGRRASWSDVSHNQEMDTSARGTLSLGGPKQIAFVPRGRPVIDGLPDRAWRLAPSIRTETFVLGSSGATAEVKLLWSGDQLYVYATVTDPLLSTASPNPWEEDSVEIFVDRNNGQTTSYQGDDAQFRVNFDNEQTFGTGASADDIVSATRRTANGYIVEAAIALQGAEEFIGFDFQVNDDGAGDGVRSSVAAWNDDAGTAFLDPSQFGVVRLLGRR